MFISAVLAYQFSNGGRVTLPFSLSGKVSRGLPSFSIPAFYIPSGNGTITTSFTEILNDLGFSLVFVPLVAILANVSIAKAFSTGTPIDASQEMIALGLCNIFGAFVQAMPTCGAFTRSAVSEASGVRTPLAGLYSGTLTVLALSFLTDYFYFIPRATLGAVLIAAVYYMMDFKIVGKLWTQSRPDFYSWMVTFVSCLAFGNETGLITGVVCNLLLLLYYWARPTIVAATRTVSNFIDKTFDSLIPASDQLTD